MARRQVLTIEESLEREPLAVQISNQFSEWENGRSAWLTAKNEIRDYIFATDTARLTDVGWSNSTHLPKLCQIRDNLYSNYISALFPHDRAIKWEGDDKESATKEKRGAIEAYLNSKMRQSDFVPEMERCVYDFIDYGNSFGMVEYVNETHEDPMTGETIQGYSGPKFIRISPVDIVFNPIAASFKDTPKIIRSLHTLGALKKEIESNPEKGYLKDIFSKSLAERHKYSSASQADFAKSKELQMTGFGSYLDYLQSQYVEILDFYGDIYDEQTGELLENQVVSVMDRAYVLRKTGNPSWLGADSIQHVGWRIRQDTLMAMGPLDNLVGMQYRIDHLENAKADGMDLIIHPVMKVRGFVEDFEYGPGARVYTGDEGDIEFMRPDTTILSADTQIALYEQKMEEMAGAPKQAMGFRTPGEKTAFEVQILENGANKVFLNKTSYFERVFLEPILNNMLEIGRRLMRPSETVSSVDPDFNAVRFSKITQKDITARGKLRPIGARHFARNANILQNLVQLMNTPIAQDQGIRSHISGKRLAFLIEELLDLEPFDLVRENVAIEESLETQQLANQAQQRLQPSAEGLPDENSVDNTPQNPGGAGRV